MNFKINDQRRPDEEAIYTLAVMATDPAMSGWGAAKGGKSRCCWALPADASQELIDKVLDWVELRGDLRSIELVDLNQYRLPADTAHLSIYVSRPGHPSRG